MDLRYIMVSLENDAYQIGDLSNKDVYINGRAKFVIWSFSALRAEALLSAISGADTIGIPEIYEKYMTFSGKNW